MYCKSCHTELPKGIGYCPSCGAKGDFLVESLADIKQKKKKNMVEKEISPKVLKVIKIILVVFLVLIVGGIVWGNRGIIKEGLQSRVPIGFYSEDDGVYFIKNGSYVKRDDLTALNPGLLGLGNRYYLDADTHEMYELLYYKTDKKVMTDVDDLFYSNGRPSDTIVYERKGKYYVYDDGESYLINDDRSLEMIQCDYYDNGHSIVYMLYDQSQVYLGFYKDQKTYTVDVSENYFDYTNFYDEVIYYIKDIEGTNIYCAYKDGEIIELQSFEAGGSITCVSGHHLSLVGSRYNQVWYLYRNTELIETFEPYSSYDLLYGAGDSVYMSANNEVRFITDDNELSEVIKLRAFQNYLGLNKKSEDGKRQVETQVPGELLYTYNKGSEQIQVTHIISEFMEMQLDEELTTLYGILIQGNQLVSMDLETGLIEEIASDVRSYEQLGEGVLYDSLVTKSVYYKEVGIKPVEIVKGSVGDNSFGFNAISYDDVHVYILYKTRSFDELGTAYFFDSKNYKTILIDESCYMVSFEVDGNQSNEPAIFRTWVQ